MEIKIPKEIKVGGHTYKIIYDDNLAVNKGQHGYYSPNEETLFIDGCLPSNRIVVTLFHEMLHSVDDVYCGGGQLSETIVDQLAEGLFQIFQSMGIDFVREK